MRIGIVWSEFNSNITERMFDTAKEYAERMGIEVIEAIKVPGAFDMPLAIKKLLEDSRIDGVVTIGCVMKGETKHDEVIAYTLASIISTLSLKYNKPVTLGVMGPGINKKQAEKRIGPYAKRAVDAVRKLIEELKKK